MLSPQEASQIAERIRNYVALDDILLGVLYHANLQTFSAKPRSVMRAFKGVWANGRDYFKEFENLRFSSNQADWWSDAAERFLFRIELCGFVYRTTPDYSEYYWNETAKEHIEKKVLSRLRNHFSVEQYAKLVELGSTFREEISKDG